jgi:hypothetical protein
METRLSGAQTAIGREGEAGPMLKPLTCWLAISVAMAATVEARANDSSAELSAGGLALTKNDAIELRAEDLSISSKQVRVNYRFFNTTSAPVQIVVAFPLPDVTYEGIDDVIAIPEASAPENFLGFATTVNGQPVVARVEQKVFAKDVERTNELRELGVPLAPYLERLRDRLDALPLESREKLVELGLAVKETEYEGEKPIVHLNPTWTLKTTYYWDQVFPPGETKIEHRYAPSVGVTLGSIVGSEFVPELLRKADPDEGDRSEIDEFNEHVRTYCLDDGFIESARRIQKALPQEGTLVERRISYIRKTAANWSGPIGNFHLVVDKQYPDNLVSFCGQGVRKIGPTTFEMTKTNFTPAEDLSILILTTHVED